MSSGQTKPWKKWELLALVAGYVLLALVIQNSLLLPDVAWSGDTALKKLQAEIFLRSRFQRLAIPYEASDWDAEGRFFPFRKPFAVRIDETYYCGYPVAFPVVLAAAKGVAGRWAMGLVVALGSSALLLMTYRLARRLVPEGRALAVGVLGLASPVLVYSTLLWAHTIAAALCTGAILLLLNEEQDKRRALQPVLAGVLLAIAAWMRIEIYGFTLALTLATVLWGQGDWKRRFFQAIGICAGFGLGMLPLAAFQWSVYGHPLGPQAAAVVQNWSRVTRSAVDTYVGAKGSRLHRLSVVDWLFFRSTPYISFSVKTAVPFLLLGLTALVPRLRKNRKWIAFNLILVVAVLLRVLWVVIGERSRQVSGLLIVMPYAVLIAWYLPWLGPRTKEKHGSAVYLAGIVFTYLFVAAFVNVGKKGGLQWGPRYLMAAFPLIIVLVTRLLCFEDVFKTRLIRSLVGLLVLFAFAIEILGLVFIRQDQEDYARALETLRASSKGVIVAYEHRWLAQMCAPLYFDKVLLYAPTEDDLIDLFKRKKPFENNALGVLTRSEPLPKLLPIGGGEAREITPEIWLWSPGGVGE